MSDNIDILIAIDTDDLPQLSQDINNPTSGLNNFVYMIVKDSSAVSDQDGPELTISANIGDNVRWRAESLSNNFEYSVMLYNFQATQDSETLLSTPTLVGGVKNDHPYTINEIMGIQGPLPISGTNISTPYSFMQSTVEATGNVTYQWMFQVNKTNDGSLVGYGIWDPFIKISN